MKQQLECLVRTILCAVLVYGIGGCSTKGEMNGSQEGSSTKATAPNSAGPADGTTQSGGVARGSDGAVGAVPKAQHGKGGGSMPTVTAGAERPPDEPDASGPFPDVAIKKGTAARSHKHGKGHTTASGISVPTIRHYQQGDSADNSTQGGSDAASSGSDHATPSQPEVAPQLKPGQIAFNHPSTIELGQTTTIYAVLSPDKSASALRKSVENDEHPEGTVETKPVQYSRLMRATLSGEGIKIAGDQDTSTQTVGYLPGVDTRWAWDVTPTTAGKHTLHLRVAAVLHIDGEEREQELAVLNEDIVVNVTLSKRIHDFVLDNWKWLWTAIVVPAGSWTALRLRKKRTKGKK